MSRLVLHCVNSAELLNYHCSQLDAKRVKTMAICLYYLIIDRADRWRKYKRHEILSYLAQISVP